MKIVTNGMKNYASSVKFFFTDVKIIVGYYGSFGLFLWSELALMFAILIVLCIPSMVPVAKWMTYYGMPLVMFLDAILWFFLTIVWEKLTSIYQEAHPKTVIMTLYGVRGWGLRSYNDNSYSLHGEFSPWDKGRIIARCEHGHAAPSFGCECGMYAYKDAHLWSKGHYIQKEVWGIVKFTGKIIEHEHGYRAEKAEVVAVYISQNCMRSGPIALDCDVQRFTSFDHMCQEYGLLTD